MKHAVKGEMFIIPNTLVNMNAVTGRDRAIKILNKLGITVHSMDETPMVQIRTKNELSQNWADHGVDLSKVPGYQDDDSQRWECLSKNWPTYFPAVLFEGKKEGDIVTLEGEGVKFEFTLKQLTNCYPQRGDFKTLLRKLLNLYYSEKECQWRDKVWTEKT